MGRKTTFIDASLLLLFCAHCVSSLEMNVTGVLLACGTESKEDEDLPYPEIENCNRKIRLKINIFNTKKTPEGLEYIFVREVRDPDTHIKMKLINPLIVQLRQNQVVIAYPIKHLSAVNGKVSEVVVNYKNRQNYTGCDTESAIRPTCGVQHHQKKTSLHYSKGFCCFCPETPVHEKQIRGGQDCSLDADPNDYQKQLYKASAHCLKFHPLWFSVSSISEPLIMHDIYLQVFNEKYLSNGSIVWVSLTHGEKFELTHKNATQKDTNNSIVASTFINTPKNGTLLISSGDNRLLIPQPMPGVKAVDLPPPVKNGATDYLLLSKSVIQSVGTQCDTAGISYEGFYKQADRCNVPKDTCLKNQPLDLWQSDNEKRQSGKKGIYFLENYGTPSKEPIIIDSDSKEHWLALEYYAKQHTELTIEINADEIVTLTPGKHAHISYVTSLSRDKTIIFIVGVLNKDLTSAAYSVSATGCQYGVPDSPDVTRMVPPQTTLDFEITTQRGDIQLDNTFTCSVIVRSSDYGAVAARRVKVKPPHRCVCIRHCQCVCLLESRKCIPMKLKDYHAAGFRGSLPVLTGKSYHKLWIQNPFLVILSLLMLLLLLGFGKAVFGWIGFDKVRDFGLRTRIFKRKMILKSYIEPELKGQPVIYSLSGFPVRCDNKNQPARTLRNERVFLLNVFFPCVWPFIKVIDWIKARDSKLPEKDEMTMSEHRRRSSAKRAKEREDDAAFRADRPVRSYSSSGVFLHPTERQKRLREELNIKLPQASPTPLQKEVTVDSSESSASDQVSLDFDFSSSEEGVARKWQRGGEKIKNVLLS